MLSHMYAILNKYEAIAAGNAIDFLIIFYLKFYDWHIVSEHMKYHVIFWFLYALDNDQLCEYVLHLQI